jgi:hypothetical protein
MLSLVLIRARARRTSLSLAAALYAVEFMALAAEPGAPVAPASLELQAEPSCATRADLAARVKARSPRVQFVEDGSGLAIRVEISTPAANVVDGEVRLASSGTKPSLRRVRARSCSEAADAIALIIAVTLDPTAGISGTKGTSTADSTTAPAAQSDRSSASSARVSESAISPKADATTAGAEASAVEEGPASSRSLAHPTFGVQVAAEATVGVAPGVMPSVAFFAAGGLERPSLWSPAVVLGVRHGWRTVDEQGGRASFFLDALTLDACPVRFRLGIFEARPCGSLLAGRMSAGATDTTNPAAESHRPFWVVGGAGIISAQLPAMIEVSGRLAFGANLVRDSFEFYPATFYTVPAFSGAASVGVGVRFR